jgi:hypothetical protein
MPDLKPEVKKAIQDAEEVLNFFEGTAAWSKTLGVTINALSLKVLCEVAKNRRAQPEPDSAVDALTKENADLKARGERLAGAVRHHLSDPEWVGLLAALAEWEGES